MTTSEDTRIALHGIKLAIGSLGASILLTALPLLLELLDPNLKLISQWIVPFLLLIIGLYVIYLGINLKVN